MNHVRGYTGLDKARLVKIADTDSGRWRFAEKGFEAQCCAEPGGVFRDEEVDAVSICMPKVTHARLGPRTSSAASTIPCR